MRSGWSTGSPTRRPGRRGEYCYLEDLFVSPDARGSGAGRALIATVDGLGAGATACAKVYWLTAETNATARALYDRVATHTGFVHYEIPLGERA